MPTPSMTLEELEQLLVRLRLVEIRLQRMHAVGEMRERLGRGHVAKIQIVVSHGMPFHMIPIRSSGTV